MEKLYTESTEEEIKRLKINLSYLILSNNYLEERLLNFQFMINSIVLQNLVRTEKLDKWTYMEIKTTMSNPYLAMRGC